MHIVEETWSEAEKHSHHCQSAIGSSEKIDSDDNNSGTSKSKRIEALDLHHSPSNYVDERIDDIETQQHASLSNGPRDIVDPTGNDRSSWAHCPKDETRTPDAKMGKATNPVSQPMLDPEVHFGEEEMRKALKQKSQGSNGTTPIVRGCSKREGGADPAHGQSGADHECLNGSQMSINEARDMAAVANGPIINLGLTNHTTPIVSQNNCNNPQFHKVDNGSTWKVYSRNMGCRKQEAHINGNGKLMGAITNSNNQLQAFVEKDTTTIGFERHNSPMYRATLQHGIQNKNVETSPNTDGVSTNQLKEATSQWELAKDMGVTCHTDQAIVIDKIRTMENSDRKEAEALGNRNILS